MMVLVDVARFYDWFPVDGEPPEGIVTKPDQYGRTAVRAVVDMPSQTEISIPPGQIEQAQLAVRRAEGDLPTRASAIAWLVGERVMPHHAPRDAWTRITVEGEPEIEAYLNRHFGLEV